MNLNTKPSKSNPSISASGVVVTGFGALTGFFVSAASSTPTIKLWDSGAANGTVLLDTFTPVVGAYYFTPIAFVTGIYITIGGTVTVNIFTTKELM